MKYLILLIVIIGCSLFQPSVETSNTTYTLKDSPTYCAEKTNTQIISLNKYAPTEFDKWIKTIPSHFQDAFSKMILWNLLQFSIRPDLSTPESRLQLLVKQKNGFHYYDFFAKKNSPNQYATLFGLDFIIKKYQPQKNLFQFFEILSDHPFRIRSGPEFSDFLFKNKIEIKNDPILSQYYFRGPDILSIDEFIPAINYKRIHSLYLKHQKNQAINKVENLYPVLDTPEQKIWCNFDTSLYQNSVFLIDKEFNHGNTFGFSQGNFSFIGIHHLKISKPKALENLAQFSGSSLTRGASICAAIKSKDSSQIWMISDQSRDPGQHLFHLLRYGLLQSSTTSHVDRLLKRSRHLFLSDPVRLVIESERTTADQISTLLKLNVPIYHAENLGNIWAYVEFPKEDQKTFIKDDRNNGVMLCVPKN